MRSARITAACSATKPKLMSVFWFSTMMSVRWTVVFGPYAQTPTSLSPAVDMDPLSKLKVDWFTCSG